MFKKNTNTFAGSTAVASSSEPSSSSMATSSEASERERMNKILEDWKINSAKNSKIQRLTRLLNTGIKKLKPTQYDPRDFLPKIPADMYEPLSKESTVEPDNLAKRKSWSKRKLDLGNAAGKPVEATSPASAQEVTCTRRPEITSALNRSQSASPRLPLVNLPSATNPAPLASSVSNTNVSTSPVLTRLSRRSLSSSDNTDKQAHASKQTPHVVSLSISKQAGQPITETAISEKEQIADNEKLRQCNTQRIDRNHLLNGPHMAPSPILNTSCNTTTTTTTTTTTMRIFRLKRGEIDLCDEQMTQPSANNRLHSTYVESPVRQYVAALRLDGINENKLAEIHSPNQNAFEMSIRRKSLNMSLAAKDVGELMDEDGALDPASDKVLIGSGDLYAAVLSSARNEKNTATSTAFIKEKAAKETDKESVYEFTVENPAKRTSSVSSKVSGILQENMNMNMSTTAANLLRADTKNQNEDALRVFDEALEELDQNRQLPSNSKSHISVTKLSAAEKQKQQQQQKPIVTREDVFIAPSLPALIQPCSQTTAGQDNDTTPMSSSSSSNSQTSSSQLSSKPLRDTDIPIRTTTNSTKSSVANWLQNSSNHHGNSAKPDDYNDSKDERELIAQQSRLFIGRKSSSSNLTNNRTAANSTYGNTTTASVLLSNWSRATKQSAMLPPPPSAKTVATSQKSAHTSRREERSRQCNSDASSQKTTKVATKVTPRLAKPLSSRTQTSASASSLASDSSRLHAEIFQNLATEEAHAVHQSRRNEIFFDLAEPTPRSTTSSAKSSKNKKTLSDKTNSKQKQPNATEPSTSNTKAATAAAAAKPKRTYSKNTKAVIVFEEAENVERAESGSPLAGGVRRSNRARCQHDRHQAVYEWVKETDYAGKPIMVQQLVRKARIHDPYREFLVASNQIQPTKKRMRSGSRSKSPIKKAKKTTEAEKKSKKLNKVAERSQEEENEETARQAKVDWKKNKRINKVIEKSQGEEEETAKRSKVDKKKSKKTEEVIEVSIVEHDRQQVNAGESFEEQPAPEMHATAAAAAVTGEAQEQTASNEAVATESINSISIDENQPERLKALNTTEEVVLMEEEGSDEARAANFYVFHAQNYRRKFVSCSDGAAICIMSSEEGVLRIDPGATSKTHTHTNANAIYFVQQGSSCIFNINSVLSHHTPGDVIKVPMNMPYKIKNISGDQFLYIFFRFA